MPPIVIKELPEDQKTPDAPDEVTPPVIDETPAEGEPAQVEPAEGEPAEGEPAQVEPAPYQPNLKYKVLKEEKEIPEWVRGTIKDAETEKLAREVFEKADGLEPVKAHRDQLQQQIEAIAPFYTAAAETIEFLKKGDLDTFFERVGLSEEQLFKYAIKRLELRENPEKLSAHEEGRQLQLRNAELEDRYAQAQNGFQQLAIQQREFELNSTLQRPENLEAVKAFDERMGPGSFRAEVIKRGQFIAQSQKIDAPVETLVGDILKLIGWQQGQQSAPQQSSSTPSAEPAARAVPKALPNLKGSGLSPAKVVPRSLDELRKLSKTKRE